MTIANSRRKAIQTIEARRSVKNTVDYTERPLSKVFGENVFSRQMMKDVLPKGAYKAVVRALDHGEPLDPSHANDVASALKDWAIERGATHFTHWFQPMTGLTAEKHDSFLTPSSDNGFVIEFSGKNLIQGEPDASSFPSGGIRSTFEARGYTGWDVTSPAFIMESTNGKTLCIPTVFCSFSGHALDKKTPLLRSIDALNKQATRLLNLLGNKEVTRVTCTVGPEQEYFLIDNAFYLLRPDIINAGRALFGAKPPKGQEMEDHYWGSIKERVLAFMQDCEHELYKLGMPVKTRHNEVAPAQFEVAPIFESSNVAIDHNMLLMEVFRNTAKRHGLRCLFHEKPFTGVNGSGKHNNWSMSDNLGNNLLEPGSNPHENMQFLVMLASVISAINKNGHLLRAAIATAGNDHRLGANEAPPAIMSVYLGSKLMEVVEALIKGTPATKSGQKVIQIGVSTLPQLPADDSDRNRTSPFAFTGNKFEFRAVGSSQSLGVPNTVLNTIVAEALSEFADKLQVELKHKLSLNAAVEKVVKETLNQNQQILFNGDNYSEEWHQEAARRGLPNHHNTIESLPSLVLPETKKLFAKHNVLNEDELVSRYHIMLENYCKTINIEAQLTISMARTMILPAVLHFQGDLSNTINATRLALSKADLGTQENLLAAVCEKVSRLQQAIGQLDKVMNDDHQEEDHLKHAQYYQSKVLPAMNAVRAVADELEVIVDDSLWPLPKFREMLYIY